MASEMFYLIKDLGFPIAMALYFMYVNNTTIKDNTRAMNELVLIIKAKLR